MKFERSKIKWYAIGILYFAIFFVCTFVLAIPFYQSLLVLLGVTLLIILININNLKATLGNFYFVTGNVEKAVPIFISCIKKGVKSPAIHLNYAILLLREGNAEEALTLLEKADKYNNSIMNDKNIMLTKGSCYWKLGELDKSIEVLEGLRAKYDYVNDRVLVTLGYIYLLNGDFINAQKYTQLALDDNPESGAAWDNFGQIYLKEEKIEEAKEAFLKALELKNDLVDSNFYLGLIYEKEGNEEKAKEYYKKANECDVSALNTVTTEEVKEKAEKYI